MSRSNDQPGATVTAEDIKPDECPPALYLDSTGTGFWSLRPEDGWRIKYVRADLCTPSPEDQAAVETWDRLERAEATIDRIYHLLAEFQGEDALRCIGEAIDIYDHQCRTRRPDANGEDANAKLDGAFRAIADLNPFIMDTNDDGKIEDWGKIVNALLSYREALSPAPAAAGEEGE